MASRYPYQAEVSHKGLNKYRIIKAESKYELDKKIRAISAQWDEQWARIVEREERKQNDNDSEAYAKELTKQAEDIQTALDQILLNSLSPVDLDLEKIKDYSMFTETCPEEPTLQAIPIKPSRSDEKYNPRLSVFTRLSKKKLEDITNNNTVLYEQDLENWKSEKALIEESNEKIIRKYNSSVEKWKKRQEKFYKEQLQENNNIDRRFSEYTLGKPEAVEWYFRVVLENIELPFSFSRTAEVEYNPENKSIVVDILLPVIEDIPRLKSVSYIKSRKEYKDSFFLDSYIKKKYDNVIYQIVLQTLNYVFSLGSKYSLVESAVINGKVNTVDKATGKKIEPYILSVNVAKDAFEEINLRSVDPKAWFKSTKGISAASLANTTPVAPIVTMSREDKRFVEGYSVSGALDDSVNLAAIDWQDFENLVREIFEKEFNTNGGEVKITQASRDGGVDAVAFDPDPIRGGKIVIQAKRYTNVVGVSAVRDLYGTVLNEGATKGILVTTSTYGSDAYEFAKGKPLTLMNGGNLLYLLEKHGYKAKIDLKEAKEFFAGKANT